MTRTVIPLARDQLLSIGNYPLSISPDGAYIVYVGDDSGKAQLLLRAMADTISHVMPGTDGASTPFFSPDGAWVGFLAHTIAELVAESGRDVHHGEGRSDDGAAAARGVQLVRGAEADRHEVKGRRACSSDFDPVKPHLNSTDVGLQDLRHR